MFLLERHESMQEKLEPLLATPPTRQEQGKQYLRLYMQQFQSYQRLIQTTNKYFILYFAIHIIALITFHLLLVSLLSSAAPFKYLLLLPDFLWAVQAFLFKKVLAVENPHLLGEKRIKLITTIRPTQVYFIGVLVVIMLLFLRNAFISSNYALLLLDIFLGLLNLRMILQINNKEAQVCSLLNCLRQRQFYLVPVVQSHQAEEPFEIDQHQNDKNEQNTDSSFKVSFQKFYRPVKRKDFIEEEIQQELECQLYSH